MKTVQKRHMSRFSFYSAYDYVMSSCCIPREERQQLSVERLDVQIKKNSILLHEIATELGALEKQKQHAMNNKNQTMLKAVIQKKSFALKRKDKIESLLSFLEYTRNNIADADQLKDTVSVLTDVQREFKALDTKSLYNKFGVITDKLADSTTDLAEANAALADPNTFVSAVAGTSMSLIDEAANRELEECMLAMKQEASTTVVAPPAQGGGPSSGAQAPQVVVSSSETTASTTYPNVPAAKPSFAATYFSQLYGEAPMMKNA
jgi:hypothetical protein